MAEAISFRRGTTEENDQFIGVEGEIVVDMGSGSNPLSTMNNNSAVLGDETFGAPTLRFHLGNSQAGGVVLARADMANIDTRALATRDDEAADIYHKGKNLAYADLENIYFNGGALEVVKDVMDNYEIAHKNTSNIDNTNLVSATIHNGTIWDRDSGTYVSAPGNKPLAYKDTTNINTADLVDPTIHDGTDGNKPLSYSDASNIYTTGLAERDAATEAEFGKSLAYKDTTNINTAQLIDRTIHPDTTDNNTNNNKALLHYDMSNITDAELKRRMDGMFSNSVFLNGYERLSFKESNNISSNVNDANNYPSNNAIYHYIKDTLTNKLYANYTLNNMSPVAWDIASANNDGATYKVVSELLLAGSNYQVGDSINTGIKLLDPQTDTELIITILSVSAGGIVEFKTNHDEVIFDSTYLPTDVEYTDSSKGGKFKFSRQAVICGALMKNDLSNSQVITNTDGFSAQFSYKTAVTGTYGTRIMPTMMASYDTTGNKALINCTFSSVTRYDLSNTAHTNLSSVAQLSTRQGDDTAIQGIFVTEDGAYYCTGTWNFTRDNLISTIGYCDEKQNTQNISVISSGTTVTLNAQTAIYSLNINQSSTITIDKSALTVANNTAKTFEIYVTVGSTLPTITWSGIDNWLADSEQTPLNPDTTSIFTIRVQNIGGTIKVIANYGGEY